MSKYENTAAYLTGPKTHPFAVKSAPYTSPRKNEIVIKNGAVAMNPLDVIKQNSGDMLFSWIKYPFVLGSDVAGEVVEVGCEVTRFKVGDRVVGHALGMDEKINESSGSGFQTYTILLDHMTSQIPTKLSYEKAVVMPLGLSTAACGLYETDLLNIPLPTLQPKPTGKTILVWGGSSSVGVNAIQLAKASGYEVIATCSPRNFEYVKSLGASHVFDYNSKTVVRDIIAAYKDRIMGGAITVGFGAASACLDIVHKCKGDKVIAMASFPNPKTPPQSFVLLVTVYYYLSGMLSIWFKSKTRGIRSKYIWGSSLAFNHVGKAIYDDYLPIALEQGSFIAAPEPYVFGTGLDRIQGAVDHLAKGVSAQKVVVTL